MKGDYCADQIANDGMFPAFHAGWMAPLLIVLAYQIALVPSAAWSDEPAVLLHEGVFHGEEVAAESSSTWMALVRTPSGYVTRSVTITVEQVFDPVMDNNPLDKTGKQVTIQGLAENERSLFLLQGIPSIGDGPVDSVFDGAVTPLPGSPLTLGVSRELVPDRVHYRTELLARGQIENWSVHWYKGRDFALRVHTLRISADGKTRVEKDQYLANGVEDGWSEEGVSKLPELLWCGDLDRDGTYDFLFDMSTHENMSIKTLFLSSAATGDQIVAPVAVLTTAGC